METKRLIEKSSDYWNNLPSKLLGCFSNKEQDVVEYNNYRESHAKANSAQKLQLNHVIITLFNAFTILIKFSKFLIQIITT